MYKRQLLFVLADVVRSKAALGGGQVDQFRVVELKAQPLRNHFADGMAAGTDICGLRAASVRNGTLLAGRAALCMNEWMEAAGL